MVAFEPGKLLVVVFDGLRPDRVTAERMPHLRRFLDDGALFPNTASAFPSETRVQVSTVMSGHPPTSRVSGHGIMGNAFYDPRLGFDKPMDTSDDARMADADRIYGRLFGTDHLTEILHRNDKRFAAVTTGKVGNARLLAGQAASLGQPVLSIHGELYSTPAARFQDVMDRFGPCPEMAFPNIGACDWATTVLLEHTLPNERPEVAVLWLNEPDLSYHYRGISSPEADETSRAVDANFGRILDWWRTEGRADGWRIVAMSDHGHITVEGQIDVAASLNELGLNVGPAIGPDTDIALKPGYSGHFAVRDANPGLVRWLVETLSEQPWCGPVFIHDRHGAKEIEGAGALPSSLINYHHDRGGDVAYTLRSREADWTDPNGEVTAGVCLADNPDIPVGGGLHGGLHPIEINHLLSVGGDGVRTGSRIETPTGTVDVAPTVLALIGLDAEPSMAGRALLEAFDASSAPAVETRAHDADSKSGYRQRLVTATVEQDARRSNGCYYLRSGLRLDAG